MRKWLIILLSVSACTQTGQLTTQACTNARNIYNSAMTATVTAQAVVAVLQTNPQAPPALLQKATAGLTTAQTTEAAAKTGLSSACPGG